MFTPIMAFVRFHAWVACLYRTAVGGAKVTRNAAHQVGCIHHRLNGSSSHVLTVTSLSYGKGKNSTPHKIKTPDQIEIKFGMVDYVSKMTPHARFCVNLSKGGFSANRWNIRKNFCSYIYTFFHQFTYRLDPSADFCDFRQGCVFLGLEN